jgi:hypothetical protein
LTFLEHGGSIPLAVKFAVTRAAYFSSIVLLSFFIEPQ